MVATGGERIPAKADCNDFFDFVVWDGPGHNIMC
jgi:hypothetical protein